MSRVQLHLSCNKHSSQITWKEARKSCKHEMLITTFQSMIFFHPKKSENLVSHYVLCVLPIHRITILSRRSVIYKDTRDWISQISLEEIARPHFLTWKIRFWDTHRTKKNIVIVFILSVFLVFLVQKKGLVYFWWPATCKTYKTKIQPNVPTKSFLVLFAKCIFWYPTQWQTTFGHPNNQQMNPSQWL